jgi:hypothetical protein
VDIPQNRITKELKEHEPRRKHGKEKGLIRQLLPASHRILPKVVGSFNGLSTVHFNANPASMLPNTGDYSIKYLSELRQINLINPVSQRI